MCESIGQESPRDSQESDLNSEIRSQPALGRLIVKRHFLAELGGDFIFFKIYFVIEVCYKLGRVVSESYSAYNTLFTPFYFGNLNANLASTQQDIIVLVSLNEHRVLNSSEKDQLVSLHGKALATSKQLESLWWQKSRVKWHLLGDNNSKFFHTMASIHHRHNYISGITIEGSSYDSVEDIREHIFKFYKNLFRRQTQPLFSVGELPLQSLNDEQPVGLIRCFSEEEILAGLNSCGENKAPGPDGFNHFFYRRAWSFLKEDILTIFSNLHVTGAVPFGLNTAFLVLVPKFKGACDIKDIRPLSLIHGLLKLVSKVLSIRLAVVLPSIISVN
ncbi:uncharacterized protein LOC126668238 [Mercurialis annua]|uniref:uncharacterized protein LOC126668238 n=1 Tax=Mercurialis annua TaxID=3986 RepID=UPI00216007AB|nr:uncharacterized protein LOC126668238 [Mercurialis annua]